MRMKVFFISLFFVGSLALYGQKDVVEKKMLEYGFSEQDLEIEISEENPNYSFKIRTTTKSDSETDVQEASFDPYRPEGQKWKLETVNGNLPTSKELKSFNKDHNGKKKTANQGEVSESSYNITEDNDDFFILKFRYDPESLRKKDQFLANCHGLAFFNKKTKRMDKIEFLNDGELKVRILKVARLDMVQNLNYNETDNEYFIGNETIIMDIKLFGSIITVEELIEYYDYKKVRGN